MILYTTGLIMPLSERLRRLPSKVKFVVPIVQKQQRYKDCGLFSIVFATHLAFGKTRFEFQQDCIRQHLIKCIEKQHICVFP